MALPVFTERRCPRAEMMADDGRQMAPVLGGPLPSEHHSAVSDVNHERLGKVLGGRRAAYSLTWCGCADGAGEGALQRFHDAHPAASR